MLLGYTRVSSVEQAAEDKSSLEIQEKIIRGYAMTQGFSQFDTALYSDPGVSASIQLRDRPAGKRLLEDAKAGDIIISSKLDRMFRSARDALNMAEIFKEKKIKLVLFNIGVEPVNCNGISEFFFTIIAGVAQLERTLIKERMTDGKKAKVAKGGHAGGRAPYGFRIVGSGREARLETASQEQEIIAAVRERLSQHPPLSWGAMAEYLEQRDLFARNGKPFFPKQVGRIIEHVKRASH